VALFGAESTRTLLLGILLVIGLAALLLSYSRASIAAGLFALVLTILAAGRFQVLRARLVVAALLLAAAAVPLLQLGWERLVLRYATTLDNTGFRTTVWADSLGLIADFPWAGSGFGTFAAAYSLVRSADIRLFFAHAHNDPLQVVVEGGLLGACFLGLLVLPVGARMAATFAGAKGTLAVGFAAGLVAILLDSLVSFNFHIPSNAAVAAVLGGCVLGLPWNDPS
jgi:O-antigen ligase